MRKKFLLLSAISFCIIIASSAQINIGKYLIGGSFNTYSAKNIYNSPGSKIQILNSNIQLGKAVKENMVVGLTLSYGFSNYYSASSFTDTTKIESYAAGIFYRKYKKLTNKLYLFGEADALYTHTKTRMSFNQTGSKSISNGGLISFIPGISYAIWKKMQVELLMPNIISLTYVQEKKYDYSDPSLITQKGNVFAVNTNLNSNLLSSFGIGFKFIL